MNVAVLAETIQDLDPIEEMRLRTWARRHYTPSNERDDSWHPVILDEMQRKDHELNDFGHRQSSR